jgi:hypothetical protein
MAVQGKPLRGSSWWAEWPITERVLVAVIIALSGWIYAMSERVTRIEERIRAVEELAKSTEVKRDRETDRADRDREALRAAILQLTNQAHDHKSGNSQK